MRGMNRVTLVGNLGNAPDVKELETGKVVAKASLATTEVYRIGADTRAETQWHTVLFWGPLARLAEKYLRKGSHILVEGKIRYRHYDDEDAGRRYITEIIADRLIMLDKPQASRQNDPGPDEADGQADELPF